MANYNYVDLDAIWLAVDNLETSERSWLRTSHGDIVEFSKFGDAYIRVDREGFSGCCSDMAGVIMCCFVRDNVRLRYSVDGQPTKWYRYWDLIRVNNANSPYYLGLYDKETGEEICPCYGFYWNYAK